MIRRVLAGCILAFAAAAPAAAIAPPSALDEARAAFANVRDYTLTIDVHEIDGTRTQNRTYHVLFKKPSLEKIDVIGGDNKGAGIVWLGGDKVKGHTGGFLSGIRLTLDLHNQKVTTLRGDSVADGTIPSLLAQFTTLKGTITQAPGPTIANEPTTAVSLAVADPATDNGVTRIELDLANTIHLPVGHEEYVGTQLVKSEHVTEIKTNVGLTDADFPW